MLIIKSAKEQNEYYSSHFEKDMFEMSDKYNFFLNVIRKYSHKRFLDVGCGDGSFSVGVKESLNIPEVYGIDIAEEAIEIANRKGIKGVALDIDFEDFPFDNNFFDIIFCGELIEHLYNPDHLLEELYRVLSPNGVLLLTTPNMASWFNRISLLLGFQPIFTDISLKYSYGHLWKMTGFTSL